MGRAIILSDGSLSSARRSLLGACLAHALHDGYTDLIYVLLPVWQQRFGLDFAALALVRSLYNGSLAALQVPSIRLARRFGARSVLVVGTALSAAGYGLAGASGGLLGLCAALLLGGAGSSTQHPLASASITHAYGSAARGPLGTYNFAGDLGKAGLPPLVASTLAVAGWRDALFLVALIGLMVAVAVRLMMPGVAIADERDDTTSTPSTKRSGGGERGFGVLVAIGVFDNAARPAFLIYLPFLLQQKGAALTTVGLALSLVFAGGALGKAICGHLGARIGVPATVVATEVGTAIMVVAVVLLPLVSALCLLPALGLMLNGTSSVLYGTVPEFARPGQVERAFAIFYTWTLGGSAIAVPLVYGRLGDLVGPSLAATAASATALVVVPLVLFLSPALAGSDRSAKR